MYRETNIRSISKGITWRIIASITTILIVYLFFGRLDLAITAGILESVIKVILYWLHERIWFKIKWGRKKIEPFNLWFTGLPLSGKTTIANRVYDKLKEFDIPLERLDSKDIRDVVPNIGFSREDRNRHMYRIGYLIKTLQNNSISTISSFVSPYYESRKAIKKMTQNTIIVYIKADIESCKNRDYKGNYAKAIAGEYKNFTGIDDIYEEPKDAKIIIDTDKLSIDDASEVIIKYLIKNVIN
jgi:adenylylsulfate kinase